MKKLIPLLTVVWGCQAYSQTTKTPAAGGGGSSAVSYQRNGSLTPVSEDTTTPANSRPLPVKNFNTSGVAIDPATSQRQDTGNASLSSIDTKTPALVGGRQPVDGSGVTQPISAASLPLPTGAATSAKQPALGTAGTASSDVLTVQGATGMTPIKIDGSGSTQPISGTVNQGTGGASAWKVDGSAVTQPVSGTVTANQGAAGATAWKVDGSGVTQPISAASLPLPAGAATAAKQPALGTAGSPSADVITVQGSASGTPQPTTTTNGSTSALQTTGNNTLTTISGQLPASLGSKTSASSLSVTLSSDATALPTKSPVNANATYAEITNLTTTAQTFTAPSNAVGFVLEYPSLTANTDNIRWKIGGTASTTSGMRMEPGRDSGFVPSGASVSVIAETATAQTVTIQWVTQ